MPRTTQVLVRDALQKATILSDPRFPNRAKRGISRVLFLGCPADPEPCLAGLWLHAGAWYMGRFGGPHVRLLSKGPANTAPIHNGRSLTCARCPSQEFHQVQKTKKKAGGKKKSPGGKKNYMQGDVPRFSFIFVGVFDFPPCI